jgi:hypothetical protein
MPPAAAADMFVITSYAFSNLDDVRFPLSLMLFGLTVAFFQISWGTKQDFVVEADLGAVMQDIHAQVDVEMSTDKADMNNIYEEALSNLKNKKPAFSQNVAMSNSEKDQAAKDYYANVRTNVGIQFLCIVHVLTMPYRFFWPGFCPMYVCFC